MSGVLLLNCRVEDDLNRFFPGNVFIADGRRHRFPRKSDKPVGHTTRPTQMIRLFFFWIRHKLVSGDSFSDLSERVVTTVDHVFEITSGLQPLHTAIDENLCKPHICT